MLIKRFFSGHRYLNISCVLWGCWELFVLLKSMHDGLVFTKRWLETWPLICVSLGRCGRASAGPLCIPTLDVVAASCSLPVCPRTSAFHPARHFNFAGFLHLSHVWALGLCFSLSAGGQQVRGRCIALFAFLSQLCCMAKEVKPQSSHRWSCT